MLFLAAWYTLFYFCVQSLMYASNIPSDPSGKQVGYKSYIKLKLKEKQPISHPSMETLCQGGFSLLNPTMIPPKTI